MKNVFSLLIFLQLIIVGCNVNPYDQHLNDPSDWIVYYSHGYLSLNEDSVEKVSVYENEPVAIMTVDKSSSTYLFHNFDQTILNEGITDLRFSNGNMQGVIVYEIYDQSLGTLWSVNCEKIRHVNNGEIIGGLTLNHNVKAEIKLVDTLDNSAFYQIVVKQLKNGRVELQLEPFPMGASELTSWTINKTFC